MIKVSIYIITILIFISCTNTKEPQSILDTIQKTTFLVADTSNTILEFDSVKQQTKAVQKSKDSIIIHYPNFDVLIEEFKFSYMSHDTVPFNTNEYVDSIGLTVDIDTLVLTVEPPSFESLIKLNIISKNNAANFKVSYAYPHRIHETIDIDKLSHEEISNYKFIDWQDMTPYIKVLDSMPLHFILPHHFELSESAKYKGEYENKLKRKYQLRDTNVVINRGTEYGPTEIPIHLTKNKKLLQYIIGESLFIRIERFVGNKVKEIRYIIIYEDSGC